MHGHLPTPILASPILNAPQSISGPLLVPNINRVRFADQFSGSDAGGRIAAAISDLPGSGGTVDARGLEGAQTISTDFLAGANRKIDFTFGASQFTVSSANISFGTNYTYKFHPNTTFANSI